MVYAATVPQEQIANCEKRSNCESSETALHQNIAHKGENAYYYAHSRHFEIPQDAKIISGPGLVTGGAPEKLQDEGPGSLVQEEEKVQWLKTYSWADAGPKVKIYVPCDGLDEGKPEELASANFEPKSFILDVATAPKRRMKIEKLNAEINTEESKVRVEPAKGRITVVLVKKREFLWRDLVVEK